MKVTERDKHRTYVKNLQPLDVFKLDDTLYMVAHSFDLWMYINLTTGEAKTIDTKFGAVIVDVFTDVEIIVGGSYI